MSLIAEYVSQVRGDVAQGSWTPSASRGSTTSILRGQGQWTGPKRTITDYTEATSWSSSTTGRTVRTTSTRCGGRSKTTSPATC